MKKHLDRSSSYGANLPAWVYATPDVASCLHHVVCIYIYIIILHIFHIIYYIEILYYIYIYHIIYSIYIYIRILYMSMILVPGPRDFTPKKMLRW